MVITETENSFAVEIYISDLKEDARKNLIDIMGDDGNYDVFPLASFTVSSDG